MVARSTGVSARVGLCLVAGVVVVVAFVVGVVVFASAAA